MPSSTWRNWRASARKFQTLPNVTALERALAKIKAANILHYAWHEPDYDFGFTAIATAPISGAQRDTLKNYRVYPNARSSTTEQPVLSGMDAGVNPAGRANAGGTEASAVRP